MTQSFSRREALKIAWLSLEALAFRLPGTLNHLDEAAERCLGYARVCTSMIYLYGEANFQAERVGSARRDRLLPIYEIIDSPDGPRHNPRWYRIRDKSKHQDAYVHSTYLQRVFPRSNVPLDRVPEGGQLGEITVPYSRAQRFTRQGRQPLYRLYYSSVHWITEIAEGPNGMPWYGLTDELLHQLYFVPASHVRPIRPEELSAISPDVPLEDKLIEISAAMQTLTAYEGDRIVLQTTVSTGIPTNPPYPNDIPTETPKGHFRVHVKVPSKHMGDGQLTSDIEAYELPGVPWVSFFHATGVALHGTYWHDNFGRMMSHGCVNLRNKDAKWLYRWTNPTAEPGDWNRKGLGTRVRVT